MARDGKGLDRSTLLFNPTAAAGPGLILPNRKSEIVLAAAKVGVATIGGGGFISAVEGARRFYEGVQRSETYDTDRYGGRLYFHMAPRLNQFQWQKLKDDFETYFDPIGELLPHEDGPWLERHIGLFLHQSRMKGLNCENTVWAYDFPGGFRFEAGVRARFGFVMIGKLKRSSFSIFEDLSSFFQ